MEKKIINLPKHANIVIIGGGIIGCSIAYHLGHMGCEGAVLLERDELTSGSTWHAAGLMVTFGSLSETATQMRLYGRDLYNSLEAETGLATGFAPVGFIEAAGDRDRLEEYRRVAEFNRYCGVDVHEISPKQIKDLFPLAKKDPEPLLYHAEIVTRDGKKAGYVRSGSYCYTLGGERPAYS